MEMRKIDEAEFFLTLGRLQGAERLDMGSAMLTRGGDPDEGPVVLFQADSHYAVISYPDDVFGYLLNAAGDGPTLSEVEAPFLDLPEYDLANIFTDEDAARLDEGLKELEDIDFPGMLADLDDKKH